MSHKVWYKADQVWAQEFVQQEHRLDRLEMALGNEVNDEFCDLTESLHEQWWEMDSATKDVVKRLRA